MKTKFITPLRMLAHRVTAKLRKKTSGQLPRRPVCKKERLQHNIHMEANTDSEEEALSQGIAILREMTVCNQEAMALLEFASAKVASLEQTIAELLKMTDLEVDAHAVEKS